MSNDVKIKSPERTNPWTPELRERASKLRKGVKRSPETIEKIRQSKIGVKRSPETVLKVRMKNIGTKRTEEQKKRLSDIGKRRYAAMTPEMRKELYERSIGKLRAAKKAAEANTAG
jgi:hypothetical protein